MNKKSNPTYLEDLKMAISHLSEQQKQKTAQVILENCNVQAFIKAMQKH